MKDNTTPANPTETNKTNQLPVEKINKIDIISIEDLIEEKK